MTASGGDGAPHRRGPAQGQTAFFFKSQPFAAQEHPDRIVRDLHAARGKLVLQPVQRQMRRPVDPLLDEGSLTVLTLQLASRRDLKIELLALKRPRQPDRPTLALFRAYLLTITELFPHIEDELLRGMVSGRRLFKLLADDFLDDAGLPIPLAHATRLTMCASRTLSLVMAGSSMVSSKWRAARCLRSSLSIF
jgi:hypothetical protein